MFLNQSGLPGLPQCHRLMANVAFGIAARGHEGRNPETIWAPNRRAGLKGAAMSFAAAPIPITSTTAVPSTSVLVTFRRFVLGLTALPTRASVCSSC